MFVVIIGIIPARHDKEFFAVAVPVAILAAPDFAFFVRQLAQHAGCFVPAYSSKDFHFTERQFIHGESESHLPGAFGTFDRIIQRDFIAHNNLAVLTDAAGNGKVLLIIRQIKLYGKAHFLEFLGSKNTIAVVRIDHLDRQRRVDRIDRILFAQQYAVGRLIAQSKNRRVNAGFIQHHFAKRQLRIAFGSELKTVSCTGWSAAGLRNKQFSVQLAFHDSQIADTYIDLEVHAPVGDAAFGSQSRHIEFILLQIDFSGYSKRNKGGSVVEFAVADTGYFARGCRRTETFAGDVDFPRFTIIGLQSQRTVGYG